MLLVFRYVFSVPQPTGEKRRIFYTCLRDFDAHKYNFERALSAAVCTLLTAILDEGVCPGYEIIFDLRGFSLPHFATVTISLIRKLVYFAQVSKIVSFKSTNRFFYNKVAW